MSYRQALRMAPDAGRGQIRKLRRLPNAVILVIPTEKQRLSVGEVKVKLRDVEVVLGRRVGVKTKARSIGQVTGAGSKVIRRISSSNILQISNGGGTGARAYAIRSREGRTDLRRGQRKATPRGIGSYWTRESRGIWNSGTATRDRTLVPDLALSERSRNWNSSGHGCSCCLPKSFVGEKEVSPVVLDGTAGITTKNVSQQGRPRRPLISCLC